MIWLFLAASSIAAAEPGRTLPGAEVEPAGTLELRGGIAGVFTFDHGPDWTGAGPQVLVDWAPTDGLDIEAQAPLLVVGSFHQDGVGTIHAPTIGARMLVLERPALRLAPTVLLGRLGTTSDLFGANGEGAIDAPPGGLLFGTTGLALETGGTRLRFDLNLSAFATVYEPGGKFVVLPPWAGSVILSNAGLSCTADSHNQLRLGLNSLFPTLSWMYQQESVLFDLSVASVGSISTISTHIGSEL
jgi:hypothetical protein